MATALVYSTRILPDRRIEISAPELPEQGEVEIIVVLPKENANGNGKATEFPDVVAFLDSLPGVKRTATEWEAIEREFQEERDSWER